MIHSNCLLFFCLLMMAGCTGKYSDRMIPDVMHRLYYFFICRLLMPETDRPETAL